MQFPSTITHTQKWFMSDDATNYERKQASLFAFHHVATSVSIIISQYFFGLNWVVSNSKKKMFEVRICTSQFKSY